MKKTMLIAMMIVSCGAGATSIEDGVHAIVRGTKGEPHLVKLNSGEVKFIHQGEEKELAKYEAKLNASKEK
ncbi:MAG: hypothetical protein ACJ76H_01480, partial [Bacteriovoracaceae bacterium]